MLVLHGYGGTHRGIMDQTEMNLVADTAGFAVCYPLGTDDNSGKKFWNVGYDFHNDETVDDVGFLKELSKSLQVDQDLNPNATFLTGFSNGADMAYRISCLNNSSFKATAPVAGAMLESVFNDCNPSIPVPVFITNGTEDPVIWWEGDRNNEQGWGAYYDIPFGFNHYAELNECKNTTVDTLPDLSSTDGSFVTATKSIEGVQDNQVWLYSIIGGKHHWPGNNGNKDINMSQEIWNFFRLFIKNNSLSVKDYERLPIQIYPNPIRHTINIKSDHTIKSNYLLTDSNGRVLKRGIINGMNHTIESTDLLPGIYFIKIDQFISRLVKL